MLINLDPAAKNYNTPCYIYDFDAIKNRLVSLRKKLNKNIDLLYAMKSNPNPLLLRAMSKYVDGIDISSLGEMQVAFVNLGPGTREIYGGVGRGALPQYLYRAFEIVRKAVIVNPTLKRRQ